MIPPIDNHNNVNDDKTLSYANSYHAEPQNICIFTCIFISHRFILSEKNSDLNLFSTFV